MHLWQNPGAGHNGTTREVNDCIINVESLINVSIYFLVIQNKLHGFFEQQYLLRRPKSKNVACGRVPRIIQD